MFGGLFEPVYPLEISLYFLVTSPSFFALQTATAGRCQMIPPSLPWWRRQNMDGSGVTSGEMDPRKKW